jgi:beta-phosphoglucomutase
MLKVVIFDLDGLLVDSEPLQFRAYQKAFSHFGITFDLGDWPKWHHLEASASRWVDAHNLTVDPEEIRAKKKIYYDKLVENELTLKPGARNLVETLSNSYRLCVASGSRPESIENCLNRFTLNPYFEKQFSATLLQRKKPYPDVYLEALSKMQVSSDHTIAIEDSQTGLKAATDAGIKCIVCPDTFTPVSNLEFHDAALMIDSLERLSPSMIEKIVDDQGGT